MSPRSGQSGDGLRGARRSRERDAVHVRRRNADLAGREGDVSAAGERARRSAAGAAGTLPRADRRVRLGPQHAVRLREGRPAARPHRVVLPLPARARKRRTCIAFPTDGRALSRRKAGLQTRHGRQGDRGRVAAQVRFQRRTLDGEDGQTFRIKPQKPVDELRKEAAAATPPERERASSASPTWSN